MPPSHNVCLPLNKRRVVRKVRTAVVAGEDDQRVGCQAEAIQFGEHLADAFIDLLQHRGIDAPIAVVHGFLGDGRLRTPRRLIRRVHRLVRQVKKERLVGMLLDELHGAAIQQVGQVAIRLDGLIAVPQLVGAVEIVVAIVVRMPQQRAEVFIEAAPRGIELRLIAEMPFAESARGIAGLLEQAWRL